MTPDQIPRTSPFPITRLAPAPPSDSIRVVVDVSLLRPGGENGGVKPFIFEYLRKLSEKEENQITLVFLTWSVSHHEIRKLAREWDELICVRHLDTSKEPKVRNWRDGEVYLPCPPPDLLLKLKADLYYSPLSSPEFACPGVPTISGIVDVLHRDYPETLDPAVVQIREDLFQGLLKCTNIFQCISDHTAERMRFHYNVQPEATFRSHIVIHERMEQRRQNRPDDSPQRPYFLYPANFWSHKNHETLLVAYQLYLQASNQEIWDLVLTGHPDARCTDLKQFAHNLGIGGRVQFKGHLPEEDFKRLWHEAGALVFPSLHEGFGIPLVEAMHFGIPILCSAEGSLPEVANDAALYIDCRSPLALSSALTEITQDSELRQELIRKGKKRLSSFSLEREIETFRNAFQSCQQLSAPLWNKGVHIDGWTEEMAILGLPKIAETVLITIEIKPMPAGRRVRLYRGQNAIGGFDIPPLQFVSHQLSTDSDGQPLVIEVVDATNLSPSDHRVHGILIDAIWVEGQTQVRQNLLPEN